MLFVFVQLVLMAAVKAQNERSCSLFYTQENFKLSGHRLKKMSTSTDNQCISECKLNAKCHSINYHYSNRVCELNEASHLTKPVNLVPATGFQYVHYHHRQQSSCSNKFCSGKLDVCSIKGDGKDYKCTTCKDTGRQEVLTFPGKSVEDKVLAEHFFETALTSFTVSLWTQVPQREFTVLFGYATTTEYNEVVFGLYKTQWNIYFRTTDALMTVSHSHLSKWHHYLITWENVAGKLNAYIDGVLKETKTLYNGTTVSKGALMLGQDQDSYKGGLDAKQAFQGNMTSFNMWDRVLTTQEITALSQSCTSGDVGSLLKWADLKDKGEGQVTSICSDACV